MESSNEIGTDVMVLIPENWETSAGLLLGSGVSSELSVDQSWKQGPSDALPSRKYCLVYEPSLYTT